MEPDVRTIADLPFHVMGRFQSAPVIGSARGGEVHSLTGKEFFDGIREISLGLTALGMEAGDRVAIMSESRPEWLTADLAIDRRRRHHGADLSDALGRAGALHPRKTPAPRLAVVSTRLAAREDPGGPAPAAGARRRSS